MGDFQILTPALQKTLEGLAPRERSLYLFVEKHPDYKGHLLLSGFNNFFQVDFEDLIGEYRAINILKMPKLVERAQEKGYELVWLEDPQPWIERLNSLSDPYPSKIKYELFPFQLQGFNWLKNQKAEIVDWSTGTGKSVYASAKARYLLDNKLVDHVVVVSKAHHRINWVRELAKVANIESELIGFTAKEDGSFTERSGAAATKAKFRRDQYKKKVWVTNYEKFRIDKDNIVKALQGKRVYFIWDEMPTKLKNANTKLYRATRTVINKTKGSYHSCLSATAVENIPEDIYWCVRLMDKDVLDKYVTGFRQRYVKEWDWFAKGKVATWDVKKLQELGLRLAHMTHQANKLRDPEIRAQFPEEHWETITIEMSSQDRKLYSAIESEIASDFWKGGIGDDIFTRLTPLRLVANNPKYLGFGSVAQAIRDSGIELTDKHSNKVQTLQDLLGQLDGKVVLFSAFSEQGSHWLHEYVQTWGHTAVLYDGTAKQMQNALDTFKADPDIKLFVSSDKGSDSINLEQAVNVINYDLPWKYSTYLQRVNRISRITSKGIGVDHVFFYNLIMAGTFEERMLQILMTKKGYLEAVFGGDIAAQIEEISALTKMDWWFILTGQTDV